MAVKFATTDNFHFTGASGPISNVRADLMKLNAALQFLQDQQLGCFDDTNAAKEAIEKNGWVWVVTMKGAWPQNFPLFPTPTSTWVPWHS